MWRMFILILFFFLCGCAVYEDYYYTSYDPYYPKTYTQVRRTYVYTEPAPVYPVTVYYDRYWYYPSWYWGVSWVWSPVIKEYHHYHDCGREYHPLSRGCKEIFFGRRSSGTRIFR
ncbi:MAG: hypothetical protein N2234_03820 [Planctomycetota bacterium]|nr:hypothetical protein [Planctomycetota bacterium]